MNRTDESNTLRFEIAVIGMQEDSQSKNIEEFWENLENGIDSATFFQLKNWRKRR